MMGVPASGLVGSETRYAPRAPQFSIAYVYVLCPT